MKIEKTPLQDLLIIEPQVFGDSRGFFLESWSRARFAQAGLDIDFVQDNHSRSTRGTLRGLHFQTVHPQGKLVRVTAGAVFDVAVDLRSSSPTVGRWFGLQLSAENHRMLWVPPGFAHGFYVLSGIADFQYKCSDVYDPGSELTLRWDDPEVGIEWPLLPDLPLRLSDKDRAGLDWSNLPLFP